jgi:hypothetical protein
MNDLRPHHLLCILALAAAVILAPSVARADEVDPELEKYSKRIDVSLDKALKFLADQQLDDGSFPGEVKGSTAVTSLAVMAFLAKGYTPDTGPYGEAINKGIDFVLASQQANGMLVTAAGHGPMYSHGISTLMLSEVSGMVSPQRQEKIDEVLPKALKVILSAQAIQKDDRHAGGWRYQPNSRDSDISCTGWQLMSLRSARNNGAQVPGEAIDKATEYILKCSHSSGGFSYQPGGSPGLARTGTGLLCLELCGQHRHKAALAGGDWILKHLPTKVAGDGYFYYGLYYCAQGMFQLGDKYWTRWAPHMYDMMLDAQQEDGSWPRGTGNEGRAGTCYSTAMTVLAMSVSCRQLPIYQR